MASSRELLDRARRLIPAGAHSNSRISATYPMYYERAEGAYLWDADGNRYLDCTMGNGAIMLGHGRPEVTAAVEAVLRTGMSTGHETRLSVETVELLADIVPGFGKARFANTGTEALLHSLMIARQATGRERVAKAEGAYHGWADTLFVSCWGTPEQIGPAEAPLSPPGSSGLSRHSAETIVFPFNDWPATERIVRAHAAELAALLVEPAMIDIGFIPARPDYLERLRQLTRELGIVLIFDELLTGFRIAPGGARELYDIQPDLTTYGKALANGYMLAALEGRPELMDLTDPAAGGSVSFVGTFNGHQISLAACAASLRLLRDGAVQRRLQQLTERLRSGFEALASRYSVPVQLAGRGGHVHPYFTDRPVEDYRQALAASGARYTHLRDTLARHNILIAEKYLLHNALSAAHTEADVDSMLEASEEAFAEMART